MINSCNKNWGMSIVEMLIAIAIIGILASMVYIGFDSYRPTLDLNGILRELVTDLRYAQELSVSEQVKHGIQFFQTEKKYQIIRYGDTEEVIKEKNLPQGVSFQSITGLSLDRVRFNSYGAVEESGTVILVNEESHTRTIQIKPSGFIEAN